MQGIKYVLYPVSEIHSLESKAIKGPEERLRLKPHLVEDEMGEGAEGKGEEPGFLTASVEVKPENADEDEKRKRVAKYPPIAESISKEEVPHEFINNVGKKGADEQNPDIYAISQRGKAGCLALSGAVPGGNRFGRYLKALPVLSGGEGVASE
jgi:hypothetical protein